MEQVFTIKRWALTLILLFVTLNTGQANSDNVKKVGDTVVLSPGPVDAAITSITWKHNSNLAVEWYGDKTDFYPNFKDRCELNTKTGELTFPGVTLGDSGRYTPEINNKVLTPTEIKVISEVPKPTVSESCDAEKTYCVLTCEGITTDAEQVTYTWWSGNKTRGETKELKITKEDKEPSFFCKMKNPVSSESSEEVSNPFITPPDPGNNDNGLHWSLIVFLVLLVCVIVGAIGVVIYKHIKGKYPPLVLRALSFFETFLCCRKADSSQASPNTVPEEERFIKDKKNAAQEPSNLETMIETGVQATPQDQKTDVSTGTMNGTETTPETPANQGPPPKPQRSSSSLDARVTPLQDQKTDVSTGNINGPETTPENQGPPAESPTPFPSGTSGQPDVQAPSPQDQTMGVSTGTMNGTETSSEKSDDQGAPPEPPPSGSSSDDVTPLQDQQTDESARTNNGSENPSEKPVVDESPPPDLEKTTVTPNSEAPNPNMEETQANED